MNKMVKIGLLVLVIIVIILAGIWCVNQLGIQTAFYTADREKDPKNPSRGYYIQMRSADKDRLEEEEETVRLCLLAYDLYPYKGSSIPSEKLDELEVFLQEAQRRNIKCIFRAAYGFDEEVVNDADSKEQIASHVAQIAPILNRYSSQVYCVQAGFFGPWGEWHSSTWLGDEQAGKENRNWLLSLLLEALDEQIVINVRRPRFIRDAWEAGLNPGRLAFHNDGLLSTEIDYGTYDDQAYNREQELEWLDKNIHLAQNGGEMPLVNSYSQSHNAIKEFKQLNISYLNLKYNEDVLDNWEEEQVEGEDALSYISKRIGYRYYVPGITYPKTVRKGIFAFGQKLTLALHNEGFAPIDDRYILEVILDDQDGNPHVYATFEDVGDIEIPIKKAREYSYDRVGIRISEKEDMEKDPRNCVELVNSESVYKEGINYLPTI